MNKVTVLPYDSIWQHLYIEEHQNIQKLLKDKIEAIHHIGSTSIPGLSARPVIDILIEVKHQSYMEECIRLLSKLGYMRDAIKSTDQHERYYKVDEGERKVQLHLFETGHPRITELIVFRDYLRTFSGERDRYNHLKEELARLYPFDYDGYNKAKHIFVTVLEVKALNWNGTVSEKAYG